MQPTFLNEKIRREQVESVPTVLSVRANKFAKSVAKPAQQFGHAMQI